MSPIATPMNSPLPSRLPSSNPIARQVFNDGKFQCRCSAKHENLSSLFSGITTSVPSADPIITLCAAPSILPRLTLNSSPIEFPTTSLIVSPTGAPINVPSTSLRC